MRIKQIKQTKRELSDRIFELDKRLYELENLVADLAQKQGFFVQRGATLVPLDKTPRELPF